MQEKCGKTKSAWVNYVSAWEFEERKLCHTLRSDNILLCIKEAVQEF
jgi:hypothetical protein